MPIGSQCRMVQGVISHSDVHLNLDRAPCGVVAESREYGGQGLWPGAVPRASFLLRLGVNVMAHGIPQVGARDSDWLPLLGETEYVSTERPRV